MQKPLKSYKRARINQLLSTFKNLQLNCKFQDLSNNDLEYLASQATHSYRTIDLQYNFITRQGLPALRLMDFSKCESINLNNNHIGSQGVKLLSTLPLEHLHTIGLAKNRIDNAGLLHLSKCQWQNIESLNLSHNLISSGVASLILLDCKKMRAINISYNRMKNASKVELFKANWNLKSIRFTNEVYQDFRDTLVEMNYLEQQLNQMYNHENFI